MNRLQKKCVIGTAGVHLLLIVILFVGPAFFYSRPKADDLQVLDVIPANLIDAPFNSGVANAAPPPPQPPAPVITPPEPVKVEKVEPVKPPEKLSPEDLRPADKIAKTEPRKTQISTQLVARAAPKDSGSANDAARAKAIRSALRNLKSNLTPGTTIDMPGNSSVAYANYGTVVVSAYRHAWVPPAGMATDNAMMKFTVTIASDGTVISARITEPSGDANIDSAVQRMLDRVTFIAPFPEGATEKQRSYPVNFNATRRTLE